MLGFDSLRSHATRLGRVAVRSFVSTVLVFLLAGVILAGAGFYVLRDNPGFGFLVAVIALFQALLIGVALGGKRAIIVALAHGLRSMELGRRAVRGVFEHALGVPADQATGQPGGWVARGLERLPLAQAEKRLSQAVDHLLAAQPEGGGVAGWFRRRLHAILLPLVQGITSAQFRQTGTAQGGIDLVRVRTVLEARIDEMLMDKLTGGLRLWTIVAVLGLPALVVIDVYVAMILIGK